MSRACSASDDEDALAGGRCAMMENRRELDQGVRKLGDFLRAETAVAGRDRAKTHALELAGSERAGVMLAASAPRTMRSISRRCSAS